MKSAGPLHSLRALLLKPVHEICLGTVKAAIWRDRAGESVRYNVTFSRLYKNDEEKWKSWDSFGRDGLPKLSLVAYKACEWIFTPAAAE